MNLLDLRNLLNEGINNDLGLTEVQASLDGGENATDYVLGVYFGPQGDKIVLNIGQPPVPAAEPEQYQVSQEAAEALVGRIVKVEYKDSKDQNKSQSGVLRPLVRHGENVWIDFEWGFTVQLSKVLSLQEA